MKRWINETCKDCRFQVAFLCRKNPPGLRGFTVSESALNIYSRVAVPFNGDKMLYQVACSRYECRKEEI